VPPTLLSIRTAVIFLIALAAGATGAGLVYAARHHVAEAVLAGLCAAGATTVACNGLIG
jgi:hypothetical protein